MAYISHKTKIDKGDREERKKRERKIKIMYVHKQNIPLQTHLASIKIFTLLCE
jgi:hypothetical protein